jgi:biopolymer transport protein TolR
MVAAPMMRHAVRVTLPKGSLQESKGVKEELVVYVDKDNDIFFETKKVATQELARQLQARVGTRQEVIIFIRADKNASWGVVLELFESLRSVKGIAHVVLPTQKIN